MLKFFDRHKDGQTDRVITIGHPPSGGAIRTDIVITIGHPPSGGALVTNNQLSHVH